MTLSSDLNFLMSWSFDTLPPLSCIKHHWIFKSLYLAFSLILLWNCQNRTIQNKRSKYLIFTTLPNLVINKLQTNFLEQTEKYKLLYQSKHLGNTCISFWLTYFSGHGCWLRSDGIFLRAMIMWFVTIKSLPSSCPFSLAHMDSKYLYSCAE
jgi:CDP-diglyceride synthetase